MKLNRFDRELIIGKLKDLTDEKQSKINLSRTFERKDLKPAIINFDTVQNMPNNNETEVKQARLKRESAQAMVNSCDLEIELLNENIERLERILINNKF